VGTVENSRPPGNLPAPLSTFIGRQSEIAAVKQLLAEYRLLTLTGPGGCGKTRLALRVGSELDGSYPDGVWLVELASLTDEALVPQEVAAALGVRGRGGQAIVDTLLAHLRARTALLILDNCEHLIGAAASLAATLLAICPNIRLLATSREPLGVPGEAVWAVPPLALPQRQPWRGPAGEAMLTVFERSEAIQLFVARARAASPAFALTPQNAPWVAEICIRLDGLPLAIELAAVRTRALSARQIVERLDDRFVLLAGWARAIPPRHQALEATLDWSYALLTEAEQVVLRRLAVFAWGWTLEAAESVVSGEPVAPAEVLNVLSNLVDKSLVVVESSSGRRYYRFLETIRQYAQRKLAAAGEVEMTRDRHLDYFLHWAEAGAPHLFAADQSEWLERFDAEHDNLCVALDWSQAAAGRGARGLRLAAACGRFWRLHGYLSEGRERLAAALNGAEAQERTAARAWALLWAARLAYLQSDYPGAGPPAAEALAIFRELGSPARKGVAEALDTLGELATEVGDYAAAPGMFEEALAIFRALGEDHGTADMLMQLGWAAMRVGAYERADALLNESLSIFRRLDTPAMLGFVLSGLGELATRRRRPEEAWTFLEESLAIRRAIGESWGIATALGSMGWAALQQRDFDRMRERLRESLAIRAALGDRGGVAWCLEKLAEAVVLQASPLPPARRRQALLRATRLFGTAAALRAPLHSVIDPADRPHYERLLADMRLAVGDDAFHHAWGEGETTPMTEAIALALEPVVLPADAATLAGARATKLKFGGLTARERETARLIARGQSNREIAAAMTVGEKTVETYVTRILNKLGFDSRVQIATWAVDKGLVSTEE
jgi:non-specific serine/threonine protein kinase